MSKLTECLMKCPAKWEWSFFYHVRDIKDKDTNYPIGSVLVPSDGHGPLFANMLAASCGAG